MLEVIVENGFALNLPADVQINFIEENPLFLDDRIPAPYSLTFEVPPTPGNVKALGFAGRITSQSVKRKLAAEIRHTGLVMARGEIILIETDPVIKLQFKGSREPEEISRNLNQIDQGSRSFGSFQYHPEDLDYNSTTLDPYVQGMRSEAYQGSDFVIAPVRLKDVSWSGSENQGGMKNSVKQYINFFNPVTKNFFITDIHKAHTPILPFPFVYKIIEQAFGSFLESNPFATGDLSNLILISMNHRYYSFDNLYSWYWEPPLEETRHDVMFPLTDSYISSGGLIPISWEFKSFMQAYSFRDLLKNLLKIFCMSAYPGVKFHLEFNNDIFSRTNRVNWDDKLAGDPAVSYEDAKEYVFRYNDITKSEEDLLNGFGSMKLIHDEAAAIAGEADSTYKDSSTGALYNISRTLKGLDSLPWLTCEIHHSPLASVEPSGEKEKHEVVSDIRPADMIIDQYWWQDHSALADVVQKKHWWVPLIEKKSLSEPPYLMFRAGIAPTFEEDGSEYPLIMPHHTDHLGVKRLNTSLHPHGTDGLLEKYHASMKAWVEKDKMRVKGSFRLTAFELKKLDIRDKVYLRGRLFFIEKLTYTLSDNSISLIDADLIEC